MPYKDRVKQKEAVKKAVQRHREGITEQGITEQSITEGITEYVIDVLTGKKLIRYVTLSDGQVMDRAYVPTLIPMPGWFYVAMQVANKALYEPRLAKGRIPSGLHLHYPQDTQSPSTHDKQNYQT